MTKSASGNQSEVSVSDRFGDAFNRFQDRVRHRAYELSQFRAPDRVDSLADWLEAESQLLEPVDLEIKDQKKNRVVEVKLKGFKPEEIEVEVAGDMLRIFGSHSESSSKKNGNETTTKTQSFFRSVPLDIPVDLDQSHAKLLKNGKLKVVLAKTLQGKSKAH